MKMKIIYQDILTVKATFLVHQTNCVSKYGKGLSKQVFSKYPEADCYSGRVEPSKAGSIEIIEVEDSPCRFVVNLFGQYYPGKSKGEDSKEERLEWFRKGLRKLKRFITRLEDDGISIVFPYGIGCGLAGGCWKDYLTLLEEFSQGLPDVSVILAKI